MARPAAVPYPYLPFFLKFACFLLWLCAPTLLNAQTISGTLQDPSGAVIAGGHIEITGGDLQQPLILTSDEQGKFASPALKPATYTLRVAQDGFEPLAKTVDLQKSVELKLVLAIAQLPEKV
jgi:hypothetical protein